MEKFFIAYGEILKNAALNGEYRTTLLNCLNDEENKQTVKIKNLSLVSLEELVFEKS